MVHELCSSLAALAFAAMLFVFFLKRRSREIDGREANNSAAASDGTAGDASSIHASTEGREMDILSGHDHEVFLSFRGLDTRLGFTDFLCTRLKDVGIRTFKDDETLRVGEEFEPKLLQAINQSKISIPIFSKGYASSVWCLKELVQMVECQKLGRQQIKPIFYDVAPSEVRHQTGDYAKAFDSHKKKGRHDEKTMQEWKDALSAVGAISGWDLHSEGKNRREGAFAKRVAQEVFTELKRANLVVSDCFVSVDNHVSAIKEMIGVGTNETRIIGIHGMGGIGKTTIAKMIYNELSTNFQHCCFLSNIREMSERKGIERLQHQLIFEILKTKLPDIKNMEDGTKTIQDRLCTKKVLLLLDDVDRKIHMDALVGKHNWFGAGSKLIITTRNKEVLEAPEVDDFHEVNGMDYVQSLQLFSKHAFKSNFPLAEYMKQSNRAIDIAGGLPLALEIIGSLLWHTEKEMWDATLKMLESVPRDKVQSKLKISYDVLDFRQKRIFLDIACLFIGYDKDILIYYWDESILFPKEAMKVLQSLSLIKINEDNEVWMHDQLRDLGREIVCEKSDTKIEKQSRVWNSKEGLNLLRRRKGIKEVEALRLKLDNQQQYRFTYEGFENLLDLRFLEVDGSMENFRAEDKLLWHESASNILATDENSDLLPQLRWLSWRNIPPTFNITNFSMEDVVILDLSNSKITDDWKGWSHMKVMKNLKVLNLSNCRNLRRLPDKLLSNLASLEYLCLSHCRSLEMLPNMIGNLKSLIKLDLVGTRVKELPDSIGKLKKLKVAKMENSGISKIHGAFWMMEKLEQMEVSRHPGVARDFHVDIGNHIYANKSLRILRLEGAKIYTLPMLPENLTVLYLKALHMYKFPGLSNLTNLKELDLWFGPPDDDDDDDDDGKCNRLGEVPIPPPWIGDFTKLERLVLRSLFGNTPQTDPSFRPPLESLRLPRLPSSLSSLELSGCTSLCSMGDLSNLKNLSSLFLDYVAITEIQGLVWLENLRDLKLQGLPQLERLPDLSNLNKLMHLRVESCDKLVKIQGELPRPLKSPSLSPVYGMSSPTELSQSLRLLRLPSSLSSLYIKGCKSLCSIGYLSNLKNLSSLYISDAAITEIQGLGCLENLRDLDLLSLPQLEILPDLSNLNKLSYLCIRSCGKLIEFRGELPQSLKSPSLSPVYKMTSPPDLSLSLRLSRLPSSLYSLALSGCNSLCSVGDLSKLKDLLSLRISDAAITEIQGLGCLENLQNLHLQSLPHVEILPDLSKLNELSSLLVSHCYNLVEIRGKLPRSLYSLHISSCPSLRKLPDLSSLRMGKRYVITECEKLYAEGICGRRI